MDKQENVRVVEEKIRGTVTGREGTTIHGSRLPVHEPNAVRSGGYECEEDWNYSQADESRQGA